MKFYSICFFVFISCSLFAQKYKSEKSTVTFFSEATVEDIAATNEKASSLFDISSGEIVFLIPIAGFEFEKSLMQQHFNEKYMESDKFPKATFKGTISGYRNGTTELQSVNAKGVLSIHGESKDVTIPGTLQINDGIITLKSDFMVELKDFKVKIPKLLWQNIAERVEVKTEFIYKVL